MREIRTSGSEGGETGQPVFPTPINCRPRFTSWRRPSVPAILMGAGCGIIRPEKMGYISWIRVRS